MHQQYTAQEFLTRTGSIGYRLSSRSNVSRPSVRCLPGNRGDRVVSTTMGAASVAAALSAEGRGAAGRYGGGRLVDIRRENPSTTTSVIESKRAKTSFMVVSSDEVFNNNYYEMNTVAINRKQVADVASLLINNSHCHLFLVRIFGLLEDFCFQLKFGQPEYITDKVSLSQYIHST